MGVLLLARTKQSLELVAREVSNVGCTWTTKPLKVNMQAFVVAGITAAVTLVTVYLTQFLADRYRRFAEGSMLAAGFAGDLAARRHGEVDYEYLFKELEKLRKEGKRVEVRGSGRPEPHQHEERFFHSVIGKVGLLGPDLAGRVISLYRDMAFFAEQAKYVDQHHADMKNDELHGRLELILSTWKSAMELRDELVPLLKSRANEQFKVFRVS